MGKHPDNVLLNFRIYMFVSEIFFLPWFVPDFSDKVELMVFWKLVDGREKLRLFLPNRNYYRIISIMGTNTNTNSYFESCLMSCWMFLAAWVGKMWVVSFNQWDLRISENWPMGEEEKDNSENPTWASKLIPESTEGCFLSRSLITGTLDSSFWDNGESSLWLLIPAKAERIEDVVPRGLGLRPKAPAPVLGICNCLPEKPLFPLSRLGARMNKDFPFRWYDGLTNMSSDFFCITGSICCSNFLCLLSCSSFKRSCPSSGHDDIPASSIAVRPICCWILRSCQSMNCWIQYVWKEVWTDVFSI